MNIGNKIIELRKKSSLTQEKLAEKIGVSRQTLSSWEGNVTSPNLEQAVLLSKELGINLEEFVDSKLDIVVKDNTKNSILYDLIGKKCNIEFDAELFDTNITYNAKVTIVDVDIDFIKIEYKKGKETVYKLIDVELIKSIRNIEEE